MKKSYILITVLLITVCVLFSGCASGKIQVNTNQNAEKYIAGEDYQNFLSATSSFVKTDSGYFFRSGMMLYFYDVNANEVYLICDKANCSHNDSECAAYLSPLKYMIGLPLCYYENAVYVLGNEKSGNSAKKHYMYQISLENFKHKKAAYLFDSSGGISTVFIMHRGYVYYTKGGGAMKESTAALYRTKLGNTSDKAPEAIYEFSGIGASIFGLSAYGNNLFFMTSDYENQAGDGYKSTLNYMDIHTLKTNQIPERAFSHTVDNGIVYYGKDDKTIEYFDLNTQKTAFFCNIDGPAYISADSNYIYFDNRQKMYTDESFKDRKISVYDKSGKFITEVIPKNPKDDCYFGGDDIMIFKETVTGEVTESDGLKNFYVLDKSQLTLPDKVFTDLK